MRAFYSFFTNNFTINLAKTLSRNNFLSYAVYRKITIFTKVSFFFKWTQLFFYKKTQFLHVFQKQYYLSRILREVCYNLEMRIFQVQSLGILLRQLAKKTGKNASLRAEDFFSLLEVWSEKNGTQVIVSFRS